MITRVCFPYACPMNQNGLLTLKLRNAGSTGVPAQYEHSTWSRAINSRGTTLTHRVVEDLSVWPNTLNRRVAR